MSACFCAIVPPHMLEQMAQAQDPRVRAAALGTLAESNRLAGQRDILGNIQHMEFDSGHMQRLTYNAAGWTQLPGRLVWQEGQQLTHVADLDEATEGARATYEFLAQAFQRAGINGANIRMVSTIRYGNRYNNAFWNGQQMVYGAGDGYVFNRFTISPDVIGHELAHGITQFSCGLQYYGQSGALNEHFSDVIGSMVKQHMLNQTVDQADWLIGAGLFTAHVQGRALRDMLNPGTAYDDPNLGKDPQPATMQSYNNTQEDNGGCHINSGIPNRAFALAATRIGGKAWEGAGLAWYRAHTMGGVQTWCDFATYASITHQAAAQVFGGGSSQQQAIGEAWAQVGVQAG
jgi:Zn-dependent metalloprotease